MSRTKDLLKKKQSGGLAAPRSAATQSESTSGTSRTQRMLASKGIAAPKVQTAQEGVSTTKPTSAVGSRTQRMLASKGIALPSVQTAAEKDVTPKPSNKGANYNSIWINARRKYDQKKSGQEILDYLGSFNKEQLTDEGLAAIKKSLGLDKATPAVQGNQSIQDIERGLEEKGAAIEAGNAELARLKAAYDADPTQENADAYNSYLTTFKQDVEAYDGYAAEYKAYYSPEGYQRRIDTANAELEGLRAELEAEKDAEEAAVSEAPGNLENDDYTSRQAASGTTSASRTHRSRRSRARSKNKDLERRISEKEAEIAQLEAEKEVSKYEILRWEPDFQEKSKPDPSLASAAGPAKYSPLDGELLDSGFTDIDYAAINGNSNAIIMAKSGQIHTDVPDNVVALYNYIYATQGRDAAKKYIDLVAERAYSGLDALAMGFYRGSGLQSLTDVAWAGLGAATGTKDATDELSKIMATAGAQAQHQNAELYSAGNVGGTLTLMSGIAKGIGAIPGFVGMTPVAQTVVSGAGTMGGTTAVQGLGDAATGAQSWEDYVADVLISTGGGAAGGGVSGGLGIAGTNFLKAHGLTNNMLARTVVAGMSGAGYTLGRSTVVEGATFLRDPENYELDGWQLAEETLVGFAFAVLGSLTQNYTKNPTATAQADADDALIDKYFKDMSPEEAKRAYRDLARKNHPDLFHGTPQAAKAEEAMKEINRAWELFQIRRGASAYNAAKAAKASGDTDAYNRAAEDFADSVNGLQVVVTEGGIPTTEVAEAMQILNAISDNMGGSTAGAETPLALPAPADITGDNQGGGKLSLSDAEPDTPAPGGPLSLPEPQALEQKIGAPVLETETPGGASETTRSRLIGANGSDAPVDGSIAGVEQKVKDTFEAAIKKGKGKGNYADVAQRIAEQFRGEEAEAAGAILERMVALDGPYGIDAAGKVYPRNPETHMDRRDIWTVSTKGVKAFQFENPELHPYFVEAAQLMLEDLADTQPGERYFIWTEESSQPIVRGAKRRTTREIETLKDDFRYSYDDIQKALEAIINDEGQENYAAAKRVEVLLDEMLTYGHKSVIGYEYEPNDAYIEAKKRIAGADLSEPEVSDGNMLDDVDVDLPGLDTAENLNGGIEDAQEKADGAQAAPVAQLGGAGAGENPAPADRGRLHSTDPGEQAGGLAGGSAGGKKRGLQANTARGRVAAVGARKIGTISAREAGLTDGSTIRSITVVPDDLVEQDAELRDIRDDNAAAGYRTRFYIGKAFPVEGSRVTTEGWYVPEEDEIWIKVDSLSEESTATKINRHERAHPELEQPGAMARVAERLLEEHSREELLEILEVYLEKYHGAYDVTDGEVDDITGLTEDQMEVLQELAADAVAGRNRFGVRAGDLHDTVTAALNEKGVPVRKETAAATDRRTGPPQGVVRHSYGGRNANHADSETLAEAETMEMQGMDSETIRKETGWHRGMDGLWRFEIDDSKMEYRRTGDAGFMSDPAYQEYLELWNKAYVEDGDITEADLDRLRYLDGMYGRVGQAMSIKIAKGRAVLGDILVHDELFQNYPQLRNTAVRFADLPDGTLGSFTSSENAITLSNQLRNAPEDVLIHEIQHAIQKAEGFTPGASTEYWAARAQDGDRSASELYWGTAGEIEARDAATRRGMTPEQRRATPPDLGDESTVFAERDEFSDSDVETSIRVDNPPKKTGTAYKVFVAKDGQLYPPMVANPGGAGTPVGVWLDADIGESAPPSKTGRAQVRSGGKGTATGKGSLAFRPGWHLGDLPIARQFARLNPETGAKDLFPANFVWAECEYAKDVDYQDEAMSYGYTPGGKFRHSYAGLPKIPTDGFYRYRTNPNPDTVPWIITGAMKVKRILTDAETDAICRAAGVEPMQRQGGPIDLSKFGLRAGDVEAGVTDIDKQASPGRTDSGLKKAEAEKAEGRRGTPQRVKFSMEEPVEETRDLLALHNLTEDKLLKALSLGGFPMPSIAVTKADIPHTNFGDITLVFDKRTIDPQSDRRNMVYSADAWTPTFPATEYEVNEDVASRIRSKYYELYRKFGRDVVDALYPWGNYPEDQLNREGGEAAVLEKLRDSTDMMKVFLADNGLQVPGPIMREDRRRLSDADIALYDYLIERLGEDVVNETRTNGRPPQLVREEWNKAHGEELERVYRDFLAEQGFTEEEIENVIEHAGRLIHKVVGARNYLAHGPETVTTTVDGGATQQAIRDATDQNAYQAWLQDLFGGLEQSSGIFNGKDRFTQAGDRKSFRATHLPVTLENIAKVMIAEGEGDNRNVAGFYGVKSLRADRAERFSSIEEMHRREGRLRHLTEEEAQQNTDALETRLFSILEQILKASPRGQYDNEYLLMDAIGNILMEVAKGDLSDKSINKAFRGTRYVVSPKTAAEIRSLLTDIGEMPVNIFEAKPERAVGFDEILAAVVPDSTSEELRRGLKQAGVTTLEYQAGDDGDRMEKVNSVKGAKFSIEDDGEDDLEGLSLPTLEDDVPAESDEPEGHKAADELMADSRRRAEAAKAERLRNIAKEDFIGTEALEKLGVRVENSVGIYQFIQSIIENDKSAKSIRKEMKRAERRLHATEAERNFASGVAAGVYAQEDIPASMDAEKVMELADYYWAERAVATDMIHEQRAEINKALAEKMEELFKDSDDFKVSKALVLNNRTPERNMLHIFGDERGAAINAAIFDPVAVNEAERFRFKNRMHDAVRTFEDSKGKQSELTKEERAIVQQVIEGRAVGEMVAGMEMSAAIQSAAENINNGMEPGDAAAEFGLDREQRRLAEKYSRWLKTKEALESGKVDQTKVENAAKKYTELFDLFYDAINDFLVAHGYEPIGFIKGYAPHIQPEENTNLLNKSLQALGINTDVTRLPSSIAGLTADYKPNKRWNPYFLSRTSDVTQYDIATAFESYVEYMSDVLYHTDDIMRVRQASNYFRRTYAPDEIKESLAQAEELRYATTDQKAAYLRDREVISRTSAMTPADINQTMDEYVEKLYEDIKKTTKFSDLVMYLDNYANILAGKQSMADRGWEYSGGRTVLNIGNKLVRAFGRAQVAGNLSSALNQTAQLPQIIAELGARYTAEAIRDIWSGKLRRASWWQESDFLTGKKGVNYLVTTPGEMVISALFTPAEIMDSFTATIAVRGRYLKEIATGKSHKEAMKAADAFGKSIMGSRMKGSRPLAFEAKNPVSQMLHIFQVEAINQWEHLSQDLPRDFRRIERERGKAAAARSLAGVIVKMLLAAFILNRIAEETYGGTPAPFDLLGLSANFIASGENLTTNEWLRTMIDNGWEQFTGERLFETDPTVTDGDFDWGAALQDTTYNVSNDIPFLRNVAGLLGLGDESLPIPDIYGAGADVVSAVKNSGPISGETAAAAANLLFQLIPGGRQLSKTAQGVETLARGGRYKGYGDKERLQYPVERDFWSMVRALVFGNSGLPDTEEFYSSGLSGLSAGQTEIYQGLIEGGADPETVYGAIQDYRAIDNNKDLTSYERGVQERDMIRALDLTDAQKLELYHGMTGADSRAEKFRTLMGTGLSWDEVMDAYDKYAELDADEELKASQKATELARWTDTQGFTDAQAAAIKDQLKFFSIIPTEAERYEAFTGAGLDAGAAKDLTDAFGKLTPEEGKVNVSDMQRLRTIADSDLSEREKVAAIGTILGTEMETESGGKSQYALLNEALDRGYTLDEWLDMKDAGLMTESTFRKVNVGADFGVGTDLYIQAGAAVDALTGGKNPTQDEATQAINSMLGPSNDQKAVLWQLQSKGWSAKNNPFSELIGGQVREALEDDAPQGLALPTLGGGTAPTQGADSGALPGLSLPPLGG